METLGRFGSKVRGVEEMRLQELDWAMIVETILARLLDPQAVRVPPPHPRRTRFAAEIDLSRHRIQRAPPTLDQAREYMAEMTGTEVPEDHQQPFGAWAMDCLTTETNVRAGGRATVQYIAGVAMAAAGAATAPRGSPYWHGDMDIGDASDQRIGNVYESIAGVRFLEQRYDKILDLLCLIIGTQCIELDGSRLPEIIRGSDSIVWGGPFPASPLAFPEVCRVRGEVTAMAMAQGGKVREQRLIDRHRTEDLGSGAGVEIDYMERGQQGGVRKVPGSRNTTAAGIPEGAPFLPILWALPLPPPPPMELALDEPRYVLPDLRCVPGRRGAGPGVGVVRRRRWMRPRNAPAVLDAVHDPQRPRPETRGQRAGPPLRSVPHLPQDSDR